MGLDVGPKTIKTFGEIIKNSKTILWNGPMGVFEMSSFENGTKQAAFDIVEATKKGAFSLIGGGDSVAAINKYNLAEKVSCLSFLLTVEKSKNILLSMALYFMS
jgi:phosphoglycerate kinase